MNTAQASLTLLGLLPLLAHGFYEQKLINDQIITATGKRFTGDYSNNEDQYKALMNNGIAAGKAYGFNVGTALTAEQMKNLTTDIVWMVKETVTLKDGTTQTVLVPKVYLATNTLDLKGDGTLIAARHNWLDSTGDINNNGGVIAGTASMDITARNVNNRGGVIGGNKGGTVSVRATDTLNNIGGTIRGGTVALSADTINIASTTQTSSSGDMDTKNKRGYSSTRTALDQIGTVQALDKDTTVTDKDGKTTTTPALSMVATKDINLTAANVSSAGSALLSAENINSKTLTTGEAEQSVWAWTKKRKSIESRSDYAETGSMIQAAGDVTMVADNAINLRAANVVADGAATLVADTVNIEAGRATHDDYSEEYKKKKGFLSKKTSHSITTNHADTSVGSQIVGDTVNILSTNDTTISGSTVFGTNGVIIDSEKGDVNIVAAEDKFKETHFSKVTKSGFGALGGASFGKMSDEKGMKGASTGHTGSTVASLTGDVDISAKSGTVAIVGSDVNSVTGDVNIKAQNIAITDVHDTATQDTYTKFKSAGLSVSVSSPILDAAKMGSTLADQAGKAEGGTQIGAVTASSALAGYNAYRGVKDVANNLSGLASGASPTDILKAVGSVSISLGVQKSESKSHSEQSTSSGSSITAGGQVNLTATGKGKADDTLENNQGSDILVSGSTIAGKGGTKLKADDDIIALAGVNTDSMTSSNKSSGASVGVSVGASTSLNIGVNMGKGRANGNGTDYTESIIGNMWYSPNNCSSSSRTDEVKSNRIGLRGFQAIFSFA